MSGGLTREVKDEHRDREKKLGSGTSTSEKDDGAPDSSIKKLRQMIRQIVKRTYDLFLKKVGIQMFFQVYLMFSMSVRPFGGSSG